jgi:hypothetical protein
MPDMSEKHPMRTRDLNSNWPTTPRTHGLQRRCGTAEEIRAGPSEPAIRSRRQSRSVRRTPREFFIKAASGLLSCDRCENSSFSTLYVDTRRPQNGRHCPPDFRVSEIALRRSSKTLRSIDDQTTEGAVHVLRQLAKVRSANPTSIAAQLDGSGTPNTGARPSGTFAAGDR